MIKNIILTISLLFNIAIIAGFFYIKYNASFSSGNYEPITFTKHQIDSINKVNNVQVALLNEKNTTKEFDSLSANKKLVVVFYTTWCTACPDLINAIHFAKKHDSTLNFNIAFVSLDRTNKGAKEMVLKKAAQLNMQGKIYMIDANSSTDVTNFKSINDILPNHFKSFEVGQVGFPYLMLFDKGKIVYEKAGFNPVYGLTNWIDLVKAN